ncbi:MAG: oligosaccharide flippase family protein [Paludibacter sp.]|nr:oligosaccharide flippase family protein [Paludibacter sp.]
MNPLWASNLSHKDYAIMGYFDSFGLLILPLIGFSLFSYYSKEYFNLDELGRKKLLSSLLLFQIGFGLVSMLILLGGFKIYFLVNKISFPFFPYAFLSFFKVYIVNIYTFYILNLKLERKALKYFKINVYYVVLSTLLILIFVVFLHKGAYGNMLSVFLTATIFSIYALFKQIRKIQIDFDIIKKALSFCWPLIFSAILTYFFTGFDKLLLEKVDDIYRFGLYNVGFKFASYFTIFTLTVNSTFEPDFYEAIANRNKAKLVKTIILINAIIIIPIVIFLLSSNFIIGILTNYRYSDAAPYARILAVSNITQSVSFTLSTVIIAYGYSKVSLIEKIIGTAFTIGMYIYLIKKFGFIGAAWGNVLCYLGMSLISGLILIYLYKKNKSRYSKINI